MKCQIPFMQLLLLFNLANVTAHQFSTRSITPVQISYSSYMNSIRVKGGSMAEVNAMSVNGGSAEEDIAESTEATEEATEEAHVTTTTEEAATAMASPPLRISTSQMGNEIVTLSDKHEEKRLTKRQIRRQAIQERRAKRREEKSHRIYAKKLKNRNNLNIKRKLLHAGFGFFFAFMNQIVPRETFVPAMAFLSTATFFVEVLRYRPGFGWMNHAMGIILGGTLRKHEMEGKFTGSFYYFLGVTVTAALYPTSAASLGICQLALADPSASYFGRQTKDVYWSRIENGFFGIGRNKGLLGFLGGALTCFPFNVYMLSKAKFAGEVTKQSIAVASLAMGLTGSFADLCVPSPALTMPKKIFGVPMLPFHLDDNIAVPIFSGYACTKIFDAIGWGADGVELAKYLWF